MDITSRTCVELGGTWQIAFDKENEGAKKTGLDRVIQANKHYLLRYPGFGIFLIRMKKVLRFIALTSRFLLNGTGKPS